MLSQSSAYRIVVFLATLLSIFSTSHSHNAKATTSRWSSCRCVKSSSATAWARNHTSLSTTVILSTPDLKPPGSEGKKESQPPKEHDQNACKCEIEIAKLREEITSLRIESAILKSQVTVEIDSAGGKSIDLKSIVDRLDQRLQRLEPLLLKPESVTLAAFETHKTKTEHADKQFNDSILKAVSLVETTVKRRLDATDSSREHKTIEIVRNHDELKKEVENERSWYKWILSLVTGFLAFVGYGTVKYQTQKFVAPIAQKVAKKNSL